MNTYCSMKAGVKSCDANGNSGPIPCQQRVDNYFKTLETTYPDDFEQRKNTLDVHVLYKSEGGMPHGRLPIANGVVKKSTVKAPAKPHNVRPSNSMSYNQLLARNTQLEQSNHHSFVLCKHLWAIYDKLGLEVPSKIVQIEAYHASTSVQPGYLILLNDSSFLVNL